MVNAAAGNPSTLQDDGDSPDAVDLSSFPLLRIDQIHLHDNQTLERAEDRLVELQREAGMEAIASFVAKLLHVIRREISDRRATVSVSTSRHDGGHNDAADGSTNASINIKPSAPPQKQQQQPTPTKKPSGRKPSWIGNRSNVSTTTNSSTVVSFISSPKSSSSNFRSRAKAAKESLRARSQTSIMEQSENERAERTRQVLDTMQSWRAEREKSKAQRAALFEEEARMRRQRRKERLEREKQVRDMMHAAAEEAKANALELGCTEEEAVVEAAAAASRAANVVDNSSSVDSDDDSYLDDGSEGEEDLPKVLLDDTAIPNDSSQTIKEDNQYERPPMAITANPVDEIESTRENDDGDCCSRESKEDQDSSPFATKPLSPTETKSSDDDQAINSPLVGPNEENELHHLNQDVGPLENDTALTTEDAQPPAEIEQQTISMLDESNGSQTPSPRDELDVVDSATTASLPAPETEQTPIAIRSSPHYNDDTIIPANRKNGRQLCELFPSFSSIFTKFAKKGKSCVDDSTQKELISCMQHQIELHEYHSCNYLQSDDDSSLGSNPESSRFYRINSRRPEVRALLEDVFSHHALAEWNELTNGDSWNLLWTWGLPKASEFDSLLVFQKVNRFRNTKGLTNKAFLKKNMQRFSSGHLMPLTYALPHEYNSFVSGYSSIQKSAGNTSPNFWIVKPIGLSRG